MQRAGQGHRAAVAYLVRAAAKYGSGVAGAAAAHVSVRKCATSIVGKRGLPGEEKRPQDDLTASRLESGGHARFVERIERVE
jgi:hypothetical protein